MSVLRKLLRMNQYLSEVRTLVRQQTQRPVLVVIGNESVDLDSAVSSICLAFLLHKLRTKSKVIPVGKQLESFVVVPVINAPRVELAIKTEVTHWLKKHQIDLDNLLCRDEINLDKVESFALVDHHVSQFNQKVISVLDHRPFDRISNLTSNCFVNVKEVGSCATLVYDAMKQEAEIEGYHDVSRLLYGAIVLDTINFSQEAGKVRPLDIECAESIEKQLVTTKIDVLSSRKKLYDELVNARADVSTLDSLQILSKDLKIISSPNGNVKVAIPGVPVYDVIKMMNAEENLKLFAQKNDVDVVVLMGMAPNGDSIVRFLGVIDIKHPTLFNEIIEAVTSMQAPDLQLVANPAVFMKGKFFDQKNIKASRKQILPVIKQIFDKY